MQSGKLYIHVGKAKAASTFLQQEVFSKMDTINYLGKSVGNYPQWLLNIHYLDDYSFAKSKGELRKGVEELLHAKMPSVISSEVFSMWGGGWYKQAMRIKALAPEARILLVLRDPISLARSFFKHIVSKNMHRRIFEESIEWRRTGFVFYKAKPIYMPDFLFSEQVEVYRSMFPSVKVVKFEDIFTKTHEVLSGIEDYIGAFVNKEDVILNILKKVNASPSDERIVQMLNNKTAEIYVPQGGSANAGDCKKEMIQRTLMSMELQAKMKDYVAGKCCGYY